jgi:hypothetical protein
MKMKLTKYSWLLLLSAFFVLSCDPDDPDPVNEEEVITRITYTLTPVGGGNTVVLTFNDADGDGGAAPVITGGNLALGKTYAGSISLLNEAVNPDVNVTAEVEEEGEDHQFFFSVSSGLDGAFELAYTDADTKGNPIGLTTELKTVKTGTGTFRITLRHLPNKTASGVKNGDITNAGGETDVEVDFPVTVL